MSMGPTENTTFTCWYVMGTRVEGAGSVPIGRPIANTQVYVLDRELNPVPIGVRRGTAHWGRGVGPRVPERRELTAEKFIPHPFSERGGAAVQDGGLWRATWRTGTWSFWGESTIR